MNTEVITQFFVNRLGPEITGMIYDFAEDTHYDEFCANLCKLTKRSKRLKFPRYTKNLNYDAFYVYSYNTQVIKIDLTPRTLQRLGRWSKTTSTHMNYAIRMFVMCYNFREV